MARVLRVSEAGFYAWRHRSPSAHALGGAALLKRVQAVHAGSHGAPRVRADLQAGGERHGRKRVARLMRVAGLVGASRHRAGGANTRRDKEARPAPDLVDRDFTALAPNQLWAADVTFVSTATGVLCLAVVLGARSRKPDAERQSEVVGWSRANRFAASQGQPPARRVGGGRIRNGSRPAAAGRRHPPFRPGISTYVAGVWQTLQGGRRANVRGIGGRRPWQRRVRELLCHAGMRVAGAPSVHLTSRGPHGLLQFHPRSLQPGPLPLQPGLPLANDLRGNDGGGPSPSVVTQARQHSTKAGQHQGEVLLGRGHPHVADQHCRALPPVAQTVAGRNLPARETCTG